MKNRAKKKSRSAHQKVLAKIRPAWISRVGQEMARGMEIRADFEEQLGVSSTCSSSP
jgi:hypothetical protein